MKRTTGITLPQAQELLLRTLRQIEDRTESLVLHALTVDRLAYAIDTATPQYKTDVCERLDKIDSMLPDLNELTLSLKELRQKIPTTEFSKKRKNLCLENPETTVSSVHPKRRRF